MAEPGPVRGRRGWRRSVVAEVVLTGLPLLVVPPAVLLGFPASSVVGLPVGYLLAGFVAGYAVEGRWVVVLPILGLVPLVHVAIVAERGGYGLGSILGSSAVARVVALVWLVAVVTGFLGLRAGGISAPDR